MPPRKSDQRKAEPSEEGPQDQASVAQSSTPARPQEGAQPEKEKKGKDKDKDKDRAQDKDRDSKDAVTIEDLSLPKSIITRLSKGVLPPNTQIQGNAILALSKSATVFISYLAAHANENTTSANKKTISPADVFKALDDTEFSFLKEPLEAEFAKFNAKQAEKRASSKQKRTVKQSSTEDIDMADTTHGDSTIADTTAVSEGSAPRAKKQRVDPSGPAAEDDDDAETEEDDEPEAEADEDDEDDEEPEGEDDEDQDEDEPGSGDETQDALEERHRRDDGDEALDGDESD